MTTVARRRRILRGMAKKLDPDAMTGKDFAAFRTAWGLSRREMADRLGVSLRSVVRFDGTAWRRRAVPLSLAKLIRCLDRLPRD